MGNNFNEGDIIIYTNSENSIYSGEVGMEQVVRLKTNTHYHTVFLDTDLSNTFEIDSIYADKCIFVRIGLNELRNGVPIVWEDVV